MMTAILNFLESHDKLSGWAQFLGAMLALFVTYLTAFMPIWRRKKQIERSALRLLMNGYEAIESYHRTSAHFLPFSLSVRMASLSMMSVADEIDRFPIFELDDQGTRSVARHLVATALTLKIVCAFLNPISVELESRESNTEEKDIIRQFVGDRLKFIEDMISGKIMVRPEWPIVS